MSTKEEILRKHIETASGFHNLTDWHKQFLYAAMEAYASEQTSSLSLQIEELVEALRKIQYEYNSVSASDGSFSMAMVRTLGRINSIATKALKTINHG